jgi:hypothetical protein
VAVTVATACAIVVALIASMTPAAGPTTTHPAPAGGMPRFYVTLTNEVTQAGRQFHLIASVRESGTGRVTGSVVVPRVDDWSGLPEVYVAAAADDRMFVIAVVQGVVPNYLFFRLTVGADGGLAALTALPAYRIDPGAYYDYSPNIALSPDGTELALPLNYSRQGYQTRSAIEVVNLSTGATRTWTTPVATGYRPGGPTWINDRTLVFPWLRSPQTPSGGSTIAGIRQLDTGVPGRDLLATRLTTFPAPISAESALVTADGRYLVAAACPGEISARYTRPQPVSVAEYSAADGRLDRSLGTQIAKPGPEEPTFCDVFSVAGSGSDILVQLGGFGRIDDGVFTALPKLALGSAHIQLDVAAAW